MIESSSHYALSGAPSRGVQEAQQVSLGVLVMPAEV
jgi:hypothetical protein